MSFGKPNTKGKYEYSPSYISLELFVHFVSKYRSEFINLLNLFYQSAFPFGKALFHHQNQSAAVQGSQVRVKQVLTWSYPHQAKVITLGLLWRKKKQRTNEKLGSFSAHVLIANITCNYVSER